MKGELWVRFKFQTFNVRGVTFDGYFIWFYYALRTLGRLIMQNDERMSDFL